MYVIANTLRERGGVNCFFFLLMAIVDLLQGFVSISTLKLLKEKENERSGGHEKKKQDLHCVVFHAMKSF